VGDGLLEEAGDVRIGQFIDLLAALFVGSNEAKGSEHPELLGDRRLLHVGLGGELLDRPRALCETAQELNTAPGSEAVHRVGDEVRGFRIDRGQIDVVPSGDRAIIAEMYARRRMSCGTVLCASEVRPLAGARESNHERCKTNPEVRASPRSLA